MSWIDPSAFMQVAATNLQTVHNNANAAALRGKLDAANAENGKLREAYTTALKEQNAQIAALALEFEKLRKQGKDLPCPYCAQLISKSALICNHCQGALTVGSWEYLKVALRQKPYLAAKDPQTIKELMLEITRIDEEQQALVALLEIAKQQEAENVRIRGEQEAKFNRLRESIKPVLDQASSILSHAQKLRDESNELRKQAPKKELEEFLKNISDLEVLIKGTDGSDIGKLMRALSEKLPKMSNYSKTKEELKRDQDKLQEVTKYAEKCIQDAQNIINRNQKYHSNSIFKEERAIIDKLIGELKETIKKKAIKDFTPTIKQIEVHSANLANLIISFENEEKKRAWEETEKANAAIKEVADSWIIFLSSRETEIKKHLGLFRGNKLEKINEFDYNKTIIDFEEFRKQNLLDYEGLVKASPRDSLEISEKLVAIGTLLGFQYPLNGGDLSAGLPFLEIANQLGDIGASLRMSEFLILSGEIEEADEYLRDLKPWLFKEWINQVSWDSARSIWKVWKIAVEMISQKESMKSNVKLLREAKSALASWSGNEPEKWHEKFGYYSYEDTLKIMAAALAKRVNEEYESSQFIKDIDRRQRKNARKHMEYLSKIGIGSGRSFFEELVRTIDI